MSTLEKNQDKMTTRNMVMMTNEQHRKAYKIDKFTREFIVESLELIEELKNLQIRLKLGVFCVLRNTL